jgi:Ca2+-binding RTX toxin-like protein
MRNPIALGLAAATAAAGLVAAGPPAVAAESCNGVAATIVGAGNISGTPGVDVIVGSAGDDTIDGGAGNDVICAGDGDDEVRDGVGKDKVFLEAGDDVLVAGAVQDKGDNADGGTGSDTADYSSRSAKLRVKLATAFADDGGAGENDTLRLFENATGGSGDDTIGGTDDANVLLGNGGADTITDLAGADNVDGGPGDDMLLQGKSKDNGDQLSGGEGVDEVSYALRSFSFEDGPQVRIDLRGIGTSGSPGEGDVLAELENATGGSGNNYIYGTDGPNVIVTGNGDNNVYAGDGDDVITGGGGRDDVYDGGGADTVTTGGGCDRVFQSSYSAGDVLNGGAARCDELDYTDRADDLIVDLGTTTPVNGGVGEADVLLGFEHAIGGDGDDVIRGNSAINFLRGGPLRFPSDPAGDVDVLIGLGGADHLSDRDFVGGNDTADGGAGRDDCSLDAGDTFVACELQDAAPV